MNYSIFLVVLSLFGLAYCSSHSEAPGTAATPTSDLTDFYMFRSYESGRSDYITFLVNMRPLQDAYGGPNYFSLSDSHFFEINIDQNHDCVEDLTFQMFYGNALGGDECNSGDPDCIGGHKGIELEIGDKNIAVPLKFVGTVTGEDGSENNLNWFEWYQINKVTSGGGQQPITRSGSTETKFDKPFDNAGFKSFPDYEDYARSHIFDISIPGCSVTGNHGRTFLGQRREAFYVKLGGIFDIIDFVPIPGFPDAIEEDNDKNNDLRWKNVDTWGLEVHKDCILTSESQDIIAAWTGVRTLIHDANGNHIPDKQVGRLGHPLVNEVVIGLRDKNKFNSAKPANDGQFADYVTNPTFPELVNLLFLPLVQSQLGDSVTNIAPTNIPRLDLVAVFLTGLDGLNMPQNAPNNLCEQLRLNVGVAITPRDDQERYGAFANDFAGFPNGRRPGDDVLDIVVQAAMGAVCYTEIENRGCDPSDAPVGNVPFTDGAPTAATDFGSRFPYLNTPCAGSDGATCGDDSGSSTPTCPSCPTISCNCDVTSEPVDLPPTISCGPNTEDTNSAAALQSAIAFAICCAIALLI